MTWDPVELDIARHADELGEEAEHDAHIEEHWDEAIFQIAESEPAFLLESIQDEVQNVENGELGDSKFIGYLLKLIDPDLDRDVIAGLLHDCVQALITDHPSAPTVTEVIEENDRIACEP